VFEVIWREEMGRVGCLKRVGMCMIRTKRLAERVIERAVSGGSCLLCIVKPHPSVGRAGSDQGARSFRPHPTLLSLSLGST
jgi:hypothetical protein